MPCKCGSTEHARTSHKSCELYSPRQSKRPPEADLYRSHERVYKIGLEKLCKKQHKPDILDSVRAAVTNLTQIAYEASRFLHLYLTNELENVEPNVEPNVDIFDRTKLRPFFTIMALETKGNTPIWLREFFQTHYLPCRSASLPRANTKGLGQCITYLVKEYLVNLENHVRDRSSALFEKKFFQYFKYVFPLSKYERSTLWNNII